MGTEIGLFLHWENEIRDTGTGICSLGLGITNTKLGMGNMSIHYTGHQVDSQYIMNL